MRALLRVRLDQDLLRQSEQITEELGTTTGEVVRMCLAQLVRRRAIPFRVEADEPLIQPIERVAELWDKLGPAPDVR